MKYKLLKSAPFGKEGDIFSFNEKSKSWECEGNKILKKYLSDTEFFEEVRGGRWRANEGGLYWFLDDTGRVKNTMDYNSTGTDFRWNTYNYFETSCEAKLKRKLLIHIHSFRCPKAEDGRYWLGADGVFHYKIFAAPQWIVTADYLSGMNMNHNSTEKDREERITLLKKVYEK